MVKAVDDNALSKVLQELESKHGKGVVMTSTAPAAHSVKVVSTGALSLDRALGCGGYPLGRIVEIFGPESAGKTTLALHAIAEVQKSGGTAAFIDAEHALDIGYAAALGVNVARLLVCQPDNGEQGLDVVQRFVESGAVSLVVVDSVAALTPKVEIDGEMGAQHIGVHARLMSQAMRKLAGVAARNNVLVIFLNQLRLKIGVMFGSPETTTGGTALKFYASMRLDVRRREAVREVGAARGKDEKAPQIGAMTEVKVVKNKLAPPFREARFEVLFGKGIERVGDVLQLAVALGIVEKSGAWFSYANERLGQGFYNVTAALRASPERLAEIESAVRGAP